MAVKTIVFSHAAAKQLLALPEAAQEAVDSALIRYATTGQGDVSPLKGGGTSLRLRVGRYRVVFDEDRTTVLAIYVGKRETTT